MLQRALLTAIRFYQRALSPLSPPTCRFTPSCSEYTAQAISLHGSLRGCWLGLRRIVRCHPFGSSGFDPVPPLSGRSAVVDPPPDSAEVRPGLKA
jgi:hypothetical protein